MHPAAIRRVFLGVCIPLAVIGPARAADPRPLINAHAHNDYHHERPLLDALAHGFCSVEADVFVVDGELLVGHDLSELRPERTLTRLYLDTLRARADANGGRIFREGPAFTLLIDFKSAAEPTYAALVKTLQGYESMLVGKVNGQRHDGAVRIVISGNRPVAKVAEEDRAGTCWVSIDGRLPDLDDAAMRPWMPLISDRWTAHFRWRGEGAVPEDELAKLRDIVARTHAQGRRLRFWATPDVPGMWELLHSEGVDLINTDDLAGLSAFLDSQSGITDR